MTDHQTPDSTAQDLPGGPQTDPSTQTPTEGEIDQQEDTQGLRLSKEAARYRVRLRETEAELERAQSMLRAAREASLDAYLADEGVTVAALRAVEVGIDDLLDPESGLLDPEKVSAAAEKARTELSLRRTPMPDPRQGYSGGSAQSDPWTSAFGNG